MPSSFAITSPSSTIALNAKGQGDTTFTVTNTSGRALRGRARLVPKNPDAATWLKLADDPERDFAAGATQQFAVQVVTPPGATPGSYAFSLDMIGLDNPDENYTQGPSTTFDVRAVEAKKRPFPWWIVIIAAIVLLAAIAVVAIINSRSQVGAPTTTPTVDANATATQDATNASATAQQAGATATAESIATSLARLSTFDQAATATAQAQASLPTVTPIAALPTVAPIATNGVVTITNVSINGGGNVATVAPGSTFKVSMAYTIIDPGCPGCIDQIQIGFSTSTPEQCAYSGVPGAAGVSGSQTLQLTAPTQPGLYYLGFDRSQDYSCPKHWWNSPPDASRYIAAIVVQ